MNAKFRRSALFFGLACGVAAACSSGGGGSLDVDGGDISGPDATPNGPGADGSVKVDATTGGKDATLIDGTTVLPDGAVVDTGIDAVSSCNDAGVYPDAWASGSAFTLDSVSYGAGGSRSFNFGGPGNIHGHAIARQADGKLLLGITSGWNRPTEVGVARFLSTGAVDTSFGTNGATFVPMGKTSEIVTVLLQSTGKILVIGSSDFFWNTTRWWIARLDANGAFDATFGTNGIVVAAAPIKAASLQADDAILVTTYLSSASKWTVGRFLANGTLDTSFGSGGYAPNSGLTESGEVVFQQADGKILVGTNSPARQIARLTATGAIDSTFGNAGTITETRNDAGVANSIYAFAQQSDGKVLAGGRDMEAFGVQRLATNGAPDLTFGTSGGWATLPDGGVNAGAVVATSMQADGKVLAAGSTYGFQYGVARFGTNGVLDPTFGTAGVGVLSGFNAFGQVAGMVQSGTNVAIGGDVLNYTSNIWEGAVGMLASNGTPVASFGDAGVAQSAFGATHDEAYAIALQPDGKAVVVGSTYPDRQYDVGGIARFTTAGAVDTSFGGTGKATMPSMRDPASVVIESTGRIVVAGPIVGNSQLDPNTFIMQAFMSTGAADTAFGSDGGVVSAPKFTGRSIALGPSDGIAAVGELPPNIGSSEGNGFVVSLFGPNGRPSPGWGDAGPDAAVAPVSTTPSTFGEQTAGAAAAAVQSDGKIVAAGYAGKNLALARYLTTGVLDPAFGTGGVVTTDTGGSSWVPGSFRVVIQADHSIVVGGLGRTYANGGDNVDLTLARYDASGQLDCSFGVGGLAKVALGEIEYFTVGTPMPIGLALASDARIFVATTTSPDNINESVLLLRFTAAGFVDARSVVKIGTGLDVAHGIAVQNDGKVVVTGRTWNQTGFEDFFVARFAPPP